MGESENPATASATYTERLLRQESAWWKRVVDVRGIYGWNLRRLEPGFTLDVGCGLGRNLAHLRGAGVGVDHNESSVDACRARGFEAFTPDEFDRRFPAVDCPRFDSLLLSHVVEHLTMAEAKELLARYRSRIRDGGNIIVITPQEAGHRSDPTHVTYMDLSRVGHLLETAHVSNIRGFSFPLPHRPFGQLFRYNEFVAVGRLPENV
jgi:SAM-dependent methyltransferase